MGVTYLLDTHVLLWLLASPDKVPPDVRGTLAAGTTTLLASAVSAMEVATKARSGRLPGADALVATWTARVAELQVEELPLRTEHALLAGSMRWDHRDPFDRLLVAQALVDNLTLATVEAAVRAVPGLRTLSW
ncbi:type II toxin-antitoxin system VapC family toxin [Actinotalea sp. Marseille-Q4924]|uniref:type II toxin-antitoxin system VapC family toxin n=1 Tax=Actinotalea sp. Marseille-Q4924 TaxID=2866571 RepID=UPI001CE48721|nr:type II toxin-antitoxin system VapC family toxin [Actinotalea sp. Marseille-Q4924]